MDNTYWNYKGKHQALYNKYKELLVPKSGEASTPHGELLRNVANVYYDFYNNGNDTWYRAVDNGAICIEYRAPSDAPEDVKAFFSYIFEEYNEYERNLKAYEKVVDHLTEDDDDIDDFDAGVPQFSEDELESIVDSVIEFVDWKECSKTSK
jgi:hypothetical protein